MIISYLLLMKHIDLQEMEAKIKGCLKQLEKKIPNGAWIGYTGTPKFPETREIFGDLLHAYTIKRSDCR